MEITYKREMKHNYLIIQSEESGQSSYASQMLVNNNISGLLKFRMKQVDEELFYYYEITSRQPLNRILDQRSITAPEIRRLITGIGRTLTNMECYLLEEGQIWLAPEYIYIDPETFAVCLCLIPGRAGDFPAELTKLLEYLLGKVNHQQRDSVVLAYSLYQTSLKDNYGLEDLMDVLGDRTGELKEERCDSQEEENSQEEEMSYPPRRDIPDREGSRETENVYHASQKRRPGAWLAFLAAVMIGGPAAIGLLEGIEAIREYGFWLAAADVATALAVAAGYFWKSRRPLKQKYGDRNREEDPGRWQVIFAEREGTEPGSEMGYGTEDRAVLGKDPGIERRTASEREFGKGSRSVPEREFGKGSRSVPEREFERGSWSVPERGPGVGRESVPERTPEMRDRKVPSGRTEEESHVQEDADTVLLVDLDESSKDRYLHSMAQSVQDIPIPYTPFVIGKQEGLADYILTGDAVSRLHARIDREGETYKITDLNSTNGTRVRGKLLEANESAALIPGDKICIANLEFIFT